LAHNIAPAAARSINHLERRSAFGPHAEQQPAKKPRKAASGQKEMLMPIEGKKPAKEAAAKQPAAKPQRKSA
jgi:DNA end-binding protein Ku